MAWRARLAGFACAGCAATAFAQSTWVTPPMPVDAPVPGLGRLITGVSTASDGADFLIAWDEHSSFIVTSVGVALLRADGGVASGPRILIPSNIAATVSAAWDGTEYLVAYDYAPSSGSAELVVQAVDSAGVAGSQWISAFPSGVQAWVSLAANGGQSAAAWEDGVDPVTVSFFSSSGLITGTAVLADAGAYCPELGWTGTGYYAVWEQPTDGGMDVYGAVVALDGTVSPPGGASITGSPPPVRADCPSLACDGAGACWVAWVDTSGLNGPATRWLFDGGGTLGAPSFFSPPTGGYAHAVALIDAGGWLATGTDAIDVSSGGVQIVDFTSVFPLEAVVAGATSASQVVFAFGGSPGKVSASLMTAGAPASPPSQPVDVYTPPNVEVYPVVGCNAAQCLVLWADDRFGYTSSILDAQFLGVRVDPDGGAVLDGVPFPALPNGVAAFLLDAPALAASASEYLLATTIDTSTFGSDGTVVAERIDLDGGMLDTAPINLGPSNFPTDFVAAGSNGTDFLVAWSSTYSGVGALYAGRVLADGSSPDVPGLLLDSTDGFPTVVSNGQDYVVVWMGELQGGGRVVRSRAVFADGGVGPLNDLDDNPGYGATGAVFAGGSYTALWGGDADAGGWLLGTLATDGALLGTPRVVPSNDSFYTVPLLVPAPYGIFALAASGVDAGAILVDGWALLADGGFGFAPALTTQYPDVYVGSFSSIAQTPHGAIVVSPELGAQHESIRAELQFLTLDAPLGKPCTADPQCASGVCDSNVCCAARGACTPPDAGRPDAGSSDAGIGDAGPQGPARSVSNLGCGCGTGPVSAWAVVALLCLAWQGLRHRQQGR